MIEYIYKRLIKGVLMKEKIYTIPVNDAFSSDCECPICSMYKALEDDAVSYTMGPSYMEDDIRAMTDKKGFCQKHLKKVYDCENRLGFALVMKTHLDRVINDIESLQDGKVAGKSMFKKADKPAVTAYTEQLESTCLYARGLRIHLKDISILYFTCISMMLSSDRNIAKVKASVPNIMEFLLSVQLIL